MSTDVVSPQAVFLKDLFTTGSFGFVILGMNDEQVKTLLGTPTQADSHYREHFIWTYGNIEFLFIKRILFAIEWKANLCTYNPNFPIAGKTINLDPWIIWNGLTLKEIESELQRYSIEFRKICIPEKLTLEGDRVVEIVTRFNARLIFRGYLNWYLEGFILSNTFEINSSLDAFNNYYTY